VSQTDRAALLALIDAGADLVPLDIASKAPRDREWTTRTYSQAELRRWVERNGNLGVRLGAHDRVLDIDPRRDPYGRTADAIVEDLEFGFDCDLSAARRVRTGSGGLHVYLEQNGEKLREKLPGPEWAAAEWKGRGRQVVAPGSLHPSGTLYRLELDAPPAPLPSSFATALARGSTDSAPSGETISPEHLKRLLSQLDVHDYADGRENWLAVMMESHAACPEGFHVFAEWSAGDETYAGDVDSWEEQWSKLHGNRPGDRGLPSLIRRVVEAGGNPSAPAAEEFDEPPPEPVPHEGRAPVQLEPFDEAAIPPFPWLSEGLLAHGTLTVLIAKGGTGKSLFALQMAYMCALGCEWGYWSANRPAKVLIVAAEDDIDEQRRRAAASRIAMGIAPGAVSGQIGIEKAQALLVRRTPGSTPRRTDFWKYLADTIARDGYDVVVCDPLISLGEGLDENSNTDQHALASALRDLGAATNCCVVAVHHSTKAGKSDQDASRGGSALVDASRSAIVLNEMTPDEAKDLLHGEEQDEFWRFVRVSTAKANYSRKGGANRWLKKVSQVIANGDERPALVPWYPVDTQSELSEDATAQIVQAVAEADSVKAPHTSETLATWAKDQFGVSVNQARSNIQRVMATGKFREERILDLKSKKVRTYLHLPREEMTDHEVGEWGDER
jgi:hypothetical protein